jgi:LMBR1 domain-containing protein 1
MIEGYQRLKLCKYCELLFPEDELNHKMTLKMIMQTDKHLQQRGKSFGWLSRPEYNKHLDTIQLYQWHRVCQDCYELYEATVVLQETAYKFSKMLGIPLEEEKRTDMVSITTIQKQEAEIHERHAMPKGILFST